MPAVQSSFAMETCVWFGVQIMAAVGFCGEDNSSGMVLKCFVFNEAAMAGP